MSDEYRVSHGYCLRGEVKIDGKCVDVYHDPLGIGSRCPPRWHAESTTGQKVSPEQWNQAREECLRKQAAAELNLTQERQ